MSGFVRISEIFKWLGVALAIWAMPVSAWADTPRRVVSINLCTDQLAMMLAAPGQLISVSFLAADPRSSAMADAAAAYPLNRGRAEELFLLQPDLVLAGRHTTPVTVEMLRRLDVPVAVFDLAPDFPTIETRVREMGALLGREAAAERLIEAFRDALSQSVPGNAAALPTALVYHPYGYVSSGAGLANEILTAAGFDNLGATLDPAVGGALGLERVVGLAPDLLLTPPRYPGGSRAEDVTAHPLLDSLDPPPVRAETDARWVCGTPLVAGAVAELVRLREGLAP